MNCWNFYDDFMLILAIIRSIIKYLHATTWQKLLNLLEFVIEPLNPPMTWTNYEYRISNNYSENKKSYLKIASSYIIVYNNVEKELSKAHASNTILGMVRSELSSGLFFASL